MIYHFFQVIILNLFQNDIYSERYGVIAWVLEGQTNCVKRVISHNDYLYEYIPEYKEVYIKTESGDIINQNKGEYKVDKLKIGWSEVSITPDKKVCLAGQFFERISEYVETPITVTAMSVEAGNEQLVICSCDLVWVGKPLINKVLEKLDGINDLDLSKIIINATHTHTSIQCDDMEESSGSTLSVFNRFLPNEKKYVPNVSLYDDVMDGKEALNYVSEKIAMAIKLSWENRKTSMYANAFGRAVVGMCRRVCYDDGSAKMWGDTNSANFTELEGGNDSGIELIYVFDEEKKFTGVVVNVACPSQVVEHRSFISSDYWGKVKILLRERFGEELYVLGLCSAAGDQCPRDMIRWVNPETPIDDPNIKRDTIIERNADTSMFDINGTWKIGRRIATEIISVYEELPEPKSEIELIHKSFKLDLPVRRVTNSEYNYAVDVLKEYIIASGEDMNFSDSAMMHVHAGTIMRYEYQQNHDLYEIEVHIVRFGDVAIATNPFELFLDYGNQIRARSRAKQTILIQLACGSCFYLPTKKAEIGGHYSAYVSSGIVGHQGGEILVRKTVEEINSMW